MEVALEAVPAGKLTALADASVTQGEIAGLNALGYCIVGHREARLENAGPDTIAAVAHYYGLVYFTHLPERIDFAVLPIARQPFTVHLGERPERGECPPFARYGISAADLQRRIESTRNLRAIALVKGRKPPIATWVAGTPWRPGVVARRLPRLKGMLTLNEAVADAPVGKLIVLADENLNFAEMQKYRDAGFHVIDSKQVDLQGSDDWKIARLAQQHRILLGTQDTDFLRPELHSVSDLPFTIYTHKLAPRTAPLGVTADDVLSLVHAHPLTRILKIDTLGNLQKADAPQPWSPRGGWPRPSGGEYTKTPAIGAGWDVHEKLGPQAEQFSASLPRHREHAARIAPKPAPLPSRAENLREPRGRRGKDPRDERPHRGRGRWED